MGKVIKKGLGRGLDAIIPKTGLSSGRTVMNVPLEEIEPNQYQPRMDFDIKGLQELAASIRTYGVTQPVIVRKKELGYELIAGERRLRASKLAGKETIPVIVKEYSDQEALEVALIENIQRQDLTPLEEAEAYKELSLKFGLTQEEIAFKVSKSRSQVANMMRLLDLPSEIQESIRKKEMTASHARTILSLESDEERLTMWRQILQDKLNVRQVEVHVKEKHAPKKNRESKKDIKEDLDIFLKNLQEDISQILKTRIKIQGNHSSGKIEIEYYAFEDLERISEFFRTHPNAF